MLVGNKLDLVSEQTHRREVSFEEANQWAREQQMQYYEISAT